MKFRFILSALLLLTSSVAFSQQAKSDKGLIKVSVMYPFSEGKTFDMAYYEAKHMPMVAGYLGSNLVKYTIEKGLPAGTPSAPAQYMAIGIFYIKNLDEYQKALQPHREVLRNDFANYTNATPVIFVSEVVK